MVPRRQCIEPGPHVKARHGGGHAAGPMRDRETTDFMATTTFPTRDDFAALLNESLGGENEAFEGKVVKGTVTAIENDLAVIDVGLKSEGRVPLREFAAPGQKAEIKVGDEVEVYVDRVENSQGEAMLSRDRARREAAWDRLEKEFSAGNRVEGVIFGRVKGGFTVDLGGAVAFLPGSQVDIRPVRDVGPLMEIPQPFQVLKMDRRRGNIVVSRRAILEETRAEQRSGLIQSLAEGQVIDGVVKNITDYGAFVDLGGIDGLLHVTDISYKRVNHPSEVLNIGDTVKVQIIRINRETQRISLGMKQLETDPWEGAAAKYPVDGTFQGRVTNITEYGAFVELEAGHRGPRPRVRDELDEEERPPGQDRHHFAGSRSEGARGRRGEAPDFARPQAGAVEPVGGLRRSSPGRVDRRGRGQELDRVRPVHRPRGRRRRNGPHVGHRLGRVGRGSSPAAPQGRDRQGAGARRRRREGAHQPRHEAARARRRFGRGVRRAAAPRRARPSPSPFSR